MTGLFSGITGSYIVDADVPFLRPGYGYTVTLSVKGVNYTGSGFRDVPSMAAWGNTNYSDAGQWVYSKDALALYVKSGVSDVDIKVTTEFVTSIFSRALTTNPQLCGDTDSLNFTVFINVQDESLRSIENGGYVLNDSGDDILFFGDEAETTLLNWEVRSYDPVAGKLIAWVRLPAISCTVAITFYMQYGNPAITTYQGGALGAAWASKYAMVQHISDGASVSATDSTANGNNGSIVYIFGSGVEADAGITGGSALLPLGNGWLQFPDSASLTLATFTWSCWIKSNEATPANTCLLTRMNDFSYDGFVVFINNGNIYAYVADADDSSYMSLGASYTPLVTDNEWHLITVTSNVIDPATHAVNVNIFIDGVAVYAWDAYLRADSAVMQISQPQRAIFNSFSGNITELRVRNDEEITHEVLSEYNNVTNPGSIAAPGFITYGAQY